MFGISFFSFIYLQPTTALMKFKTIIPALCLLALVACGKVETVLPGTIGDHMVIQRGEPFNIYGKTMRKGGKPAPHSKVSIMWQSGTVSLLSDSEGRWSAVLPEAPEGGPYVLKVNEKLISDILVGDVYLCSGQSNMELPVRRCLDATGEFVKAYSNDNIRYVKVPMQYSFGHECEDIGKCSWQVLDSDSTAMEWGALCYFTARELQEAYGVPVGMINSSVGGSPVEAWMREDILPERAKSRLPLLCRQEYVDSLRARAPQIYSEWQARHNAVPENTESVWEDIDIFSDNWSKDPEGNLFYGSHYLRRSVNLTPGQASGEAILHLGALRDADSTFVNGNYVGNITYQYPPRNYKIPSGILIPGENIIEVHLYSCNNAASFVKDKRYSLETSGADISLLDGWQHRYGRRMEEREQEIFLQYEATGLYNGMIAPLRSLRFAGAIWYQGESNCDNAAEYGSLLGSMIADWRKELSAEGLPFFIIELAAFQHSELSDNDYGWNRVQKEQRSLADDAAGIYVVKNADLGEWNDIHPQDKKTLGERTAKVIMDSRNN